jgi:peptidoglycan-associated lipoprotein
MNAIWNREMKTMKMHMMLSLAGLMVPFTLGAAGCAHAPPPVATVQTQSEPVAAAKPEPVAAPAPQTQAQDDIEAMLRGDVLHFGFDEAQLADDSRQRLQNVADAMQKHPEVSIAIAGNTDERGTEEYNLELGQRRAEVAKRYLVSLGVSEARVKTVSYGKERPAASDHDEQAWAANRRDEVAVQH